MKTCNKCNVEQKLVNFELRKDTNQYRLSCKKCRSLHRKNKSFLPKLESTCIVCKITKKSDFFHKDQRRSSGVYHTCKDCRKNETKNSYLRRKEKVKKRCNEYYYKNTSKIRSNQIKRQKERMKDDVFFLMKRRLRNRLYYALKNKEWKKNTHFTKYIGCDRDTLIAHIESQFQEGMSWDNMGKWHLDHKIPLDSAKTEQELYTLNHYTNLQPLWAIDNIKKGNKID